MEMLTRVSSTSQARHAQSRYNEQIYSAVDIGTDWDDRRHGNKKVDWSTALQLST